MISQGFFLMAISGLWYREGESIAEHSGHLEWKKYRLELEEDQVISICVVEWKEGNYSEKDPQKSA